MKLYPTVSELVLKIERYYETEFALFSVYYRNKALSMMQVNQQPGTGQPAVPPPATYPNQPGTQYPPPPATTDPSAPQPNPQQVPNYSFLTFRLFRPKF